MSRFQRYSIREKLMAMSLSASIGALLAACSAIMVYDYIVYRSTLVNNIFSLGDVIGYNVGSAVVFNDKVSATKTLASLKARPAVRAAAIYTPQKEIFASWQRDVESPVLWPGNVPETAKPVHRWQEDSMLIFQPIIVDDAPVALLHIRSDSGDLKHRFKRYILIIIIVLVIAIIVAIVISLEVGRRISEPIWDLTQTARAVSEKKDYSVRAPHSGPDELGLLIQTFNDMLTKIEEDGRALLQAHNELEQRVQERTAQLTAANKELETFSYSVSHDLRTPLRAIDGFSRILLENSADRLDEEGKTDLKRIRAATQRMAQLIDDLLKLSQVTRGQMVREDVNLSVMVERIIQDLKAMQPERNVEIQIAPDLKTQGDPALIRAALENLIGNAWKFTEKRKDAKIEFGITTHEGKEAFFVRDNGAGFDMAYSNKLFGVFQRLHDARDYAGTGVGLATVQRIIHRHGGEIWAEAAVGRGATFYFTL